MRHRFMLLLPLLLAACAVAPAPVIVYVTPAPTWDGVVLPVEAQRIIDQATATAAAQATESAHETAVRLVTEQALQDARDAATLSAAQTQSALAVAIQAGQATQAAQSTAAFQTQAAGQTQAWATPTWAALRTQAAAERSGIAASATAISVASERTQAGADGYRNLWGALVAVATLALLVLAAIAVYFYYQREQARQSTVEAVEAEKQDRARLETDRAAVELERARLELLKSMMVERDGQPWVISPGGRLLPMLPGGVATASQANLAHVARWRAAAKKAVYAGLRSEGAPQFGERDLAGRESDKCWIINTDGTPSSTGYRHIKKMLFRLGIWAVAGRDVTWGPDWDEARFEREFDRLELTALPDGEPPEVRATFRHDSAVATVSAIPAVPAIPRLD